MVALILGILLPTLVPNRAVWVPDVLSVVLVFWMLHQPDRVGLGMAFALGLIRDVHCGSVLGEQALAYTLLGFFALQMRRRLEWFGLWEQAVQVFPLFLLGHGVVLILEMAISEKIPNGSMLLAPVLEAMLWPVVTLLLLFPQTQSADPDGTL
ncbi:rod shape-determining protein MreD [Candidatus Symbiobacter mobilis CR]|uniref:Rod shape-determining protein MreD n=1 Tax=Candidatus Symbiobacter mobilis CR TaxID=946483 RepID=U5N574_9BURK|nr:rod shape-determining protein MreD [Candidatus Symbiobacter mobilis CR]